MNEVLSGGLFHSENVSGERSSERVTQRYMKCIPRISSYDDKWTTNEIGHSCTFIRINDQSSFIQSSFSHITTCPRTLRSLFYPFISLSFIFVILSDQESRNIREKLDIITQTQFIIIIIIIVMRKLCLRLRSTRVRHSRWPFFLSIVCTVSTGSGIHQAKSIWYFCNPRCTCTHLRRASLEFRDARPRHRITCTLHPVKYRTASRL